jgi:hypothetical protein
MNSSLGCVLAKVVSCWHVTVETLFRSQASLCGIYGGKLALGVVFLRTLQYPPLIIIPPMLYNHSFVHISLKVDNLVIDNTIE